MSFKNHVFSSLILCVVFVLQIQAQSAVVVPYMTEPAISPDRREIAFVSGGDIWSVSSAGGAAQLLVSHPASESRPVYSPDGRKLAFVSNRTGAGDIYVLDFATSDLQRLTFDSALEQLDAWSQSGEWIYFSSNADDIAGMNDIFRVRASGGTPLPVSADRYTNEFGAAIAPDGSLAFTARGISNSQWWRKGRSHIDESEIWLRREANGTANYEQIADRGAKQLWTMWSADGSRIYFVSDRGGAQNVWTLPLKGQAKQLTNFTDGRVLWASISGDGKQMVFERNFRIWQMNTDGGKASEVPITLRGTAANPLSERINLSAQIREFALAPDGKKVAFIARGEVFAGSSKEAGDAVRITNTAAPESFVAWSPDSRKLIYDSERDGVMSVYQYDFASEKETRLTRNGNDALPIYSPDGKNIAFLRNGRALFVMDANAKQEREICKLFADQPPLLSKRNYVWSPDGKYVAFLTNAPENRSYVNVSVAAIAGEAKSRPVSFLANSNSGSVSWSPDGSFILFDSSQRTEQGSLARIDLKLRTPKFREDQFRDLFKEENPRQKPQTQPNVQPSPASSPQPTVSPTPLLPNPSPSVSPSPAATNAIENNDDVKSQNIVFEDIRKRLSLLPTGVDAGSQTISPDGKSVLVLASSEGQFNLYILPIDELATDSSAKQLTSTPNLKSDAQFSPDGKDVYYIESGRINSVNIERREIRPLAVNAEMNVNFAQEKLEIFNQGWRFMRDNFYDEKFHGVDWEAFHRTYEPLVERARNADEVRRLMNLMVGELNASHLGVSAPTNPATQPAPVGKLGLRFDRAEYETNGRLRITEIITLSPAAIVQNIKIGDYLLSVDNVKIDGKTNLDSVMENKAGRRVVVAVSSNADGANRREIVVKPVSTNAEKNLLYRQWVEDNRAYVARASSNRLGYIHLQDMSANSLAQLYIDLDAENEGRDGVVVDVRNNNGGFINPYVIDVLSRRGYLSLTERGAWQVPARTALGQRALERPTVLITNQHSLSDAEDFTEGYRALKLGKVVGEPTAGWIIFTWNTNLFDGTTFRLPRQKVTGSDGKNMELNPRAVDVPVTRPIGESLQKKDSQLDAAVRELLGEIGSK
ncbi:MAG: PD40 domain-containing protein [Acidobacteria bacterium]|nr:PD40 domain-containing protein [Acidobacteriota bacterium]